MRKYTCIIIEDEPPAMTKIQSFVNRHPSLLLLGCFEAATDAYLFLQSNEADIILLDIEMDGLNGMEFAEMHGNRSKIIITSAYEQYAIKGYELNVIDYLLKPFTFERFAKAIEKTIENLPAKPAHNFIFIKTEYRLQKVMLDDIVYIEGMRDYRRIYLKDGSSIMTLQNFKELEQELPAEIVCRIHKSYMVSIGKIEALERSHVKINGMSIPISETYRNTFLLLIKKS